MDLVAVENSFIQAWSTVDTLSKNQRWIVVLNTIQLYGVQVIKILPSSTIYEAVIFDDVKPSTNWDIKIYNPITGNMTYEEVKIKQISDTCLQFDLSMYYDPQLYEFELEELWF